MADAAAFSPIPFRDPEGCLTGVLGSMKEKQADRRRRQAILGALHLQERELLCNTRGGRPLWAGAIPRPPAHLELMPEPRLGADTGSVMEALAYGAEAAVDSRSKFFWRRNQYSARARDWQASGLELDTGPPPVDNAPAPSGWSPSSARRAASTRVPRTASPRTKAAATAETASRLQRWQLETAGEPPSPWPRLPESSDLRTPGNTWGDGWPHRADGQWPRLAARPGVGVPPGAAAYLDTFGDFVDSSDPRVMAFNSPNMEAVRGGGRHHHLGRPRVPAAGAAGTAVQVSEAAQSIDPASLLARCPLSRREDLSAEALNSAEGGAALARRAQLAANCPEELVVLAPLLERCCFEVPKEDAVRTAVCMGHAAATTEDGAAAATLQGCALALVNSAVVRARDSHEPEFLVQVLEAMPAAGVGAHTFVDMLLAMLHALLVRGAQLPRELAIRGAGALAWAASALPEPGRAMSLSPTSRRVISRIRAVVADGPRGEEESESLLAVLDGLATPGT